jgi:hypothetical protein
MVKNLLISISIYKDKWYYLSVVKFNMVNSAGGALWLRKDFSFNPLNLVWVKPT